MRSIAEARLQPKDRAAIEDAARLLRERFSIEDIILFGSKARGDDDLESDIDLLVLTSRTYSRSERRAMTDALFPLQLRHDVVLSLLTVLAAEWNDGILSVLPIHDEIAKEGVAA